MSLPFDNTEVPVAALSQDVQKEKAVKASTLCTSDSVKIFAQASEFIGYLEHVAVLSNN